MAKTAVRNKSILSRRELPRHITHPETRGSNKGSIDIFADIEDIETKENSVKEPNLNTINSIKEPNHMSFTPSYTILAQEYTTVRIENEDYIETSTDFITPQNPYDRLYSNHLLEECYRIEWDNDDFWIPSEEIDTNTSTEEIDTNTSTEKNLATDKSTVNQDIIRAIKNTRTAIPRKVNSTGIYPQNTYEKVLDMPIVSSYPSDNNKANNKIELKSKHNWQGVSAVLSSIDKIPDSWNLTPVRNKAPLYNNWQYIVLSRDELKQSFTVGVSKVSLEGNDYISYASGIGIVSGNGILVLDCDAIGDDCEATRYLNPLIENVNTAKWTSGKPGRYAVALHVPEEIQTIFKGVTNPKILFDDGSQIEIRYERHQAVLPPSYHPETGIYTWINETYELAELQGKLADELIQKILSDKLNEKRAKKVTLDELPVTVLENLKSDNTLLNWIADNLSKMTNLRAVFSHPCHQWRTENNRLMGEPYSFNEYPEARSVAAYIKNNQPIYHDYNTGKTIDALQYFWQVIKGYCGNPKGIDWYDNVVDFALTHGWIKDRKEMPKNSAYKEYEKAIEDMQYKLNNPTVKADYTFIQSGKYLNPEPILKVVEELLKQGKKPFIINASPTGSGKTTLAKELKKLHKRITSVTPTRSLAKDQSSKLGLTYKEELEIGTDKNGTYSNLNFEESETLAICYASLHRIPGRDSGQLLLDETNSGLMFLFESSLCNKVNKGRGSRAENIASFKNLLLKSELVYACDATMTQPAIDYILATLEGQDISVIYIDKERGHQDREVCFIRDEKIFRNLMKQYENEGKSVYSSDSRNDVQAVNLESQKSNIPFMSIHGGNVDDNDCQEFLSNPTNFLSSIVDDLKRFAYSPTLGEGFSIDEPVASKFDVIFQNNIHLAAPKILQQSKRFRCDAPLYILIGNDNGLDGCNSFLPSEQKKWLLSYAQETFATHYIKTLEKNIELVTNNPSYTNKVIAELFIKDTLDNSPEIKLASELRAIEAYNLVNREIRLYELFTKEGFKPKFLVKDNKEYQKYIDLGYTDVEIVNEALLDKEASSNHKQARLEVGTIEATDILKSDDITENEYKELSPKPSLPKKDTDKVLKYWFSKLLIPNILEEIKNRTTQVEDKTLEDSILENQVELYKLVKKDRSGFVNGIENFVKYQNFLKEQIHWDRVQLNNILDTWLTYGIGNAKDTKKASTSTVLLFLKNLGIDTMLEVDKVFSAKDLQSIANNWLNRDENNSKLFNQYFSAKKTRTITSSFFNKILGYLGHELVEDKVSNSVRYFKVSRTVLSPEFLWLWDYIAEVKLTTIKSKLENKEDTSLIAPYIEDIQITYPITINDIHSIENEQEFTTLVRASKDVLQSKESNITSDTLLSKAKALLKAYGSGRLTSSKVKRIVDNYDCTFHDLWMDVNFWNISPIEFIHPTLGEPIEPIEGF